MPCEHCFSSAKETITDRRNRLHYELMEELQMLKFALRGSHTLNFTQGLNKDDELILLEEENIADMAIPDDLTQFIQFLAGI